MHAHPGALAILAACSGTTLPKTKVRQKFTATHVSTWLMASGHVLRTQKELFPEITVGGGTYGLISQQTTGVICTAIILAPANITIRASSCDAAEKPY